MVSERKPSRDSKNIVSVKMFVSGNKPVHVNALGGSSNQLKHGLCFVIAVDAKAKQYGDSGRHHAIPPVKSSVPFHANAIDSTSIEIKVSSPSTTVR